MRSAAVRDPRLLLALAASLALHGALLAATRAPGHAAHIEGFMPMSVVLTPAATATHSHAVAVPRAAAVPAAPSITSAEGEHGETATPENDNAVVEARHDVAALANPPPPYPLAARRQGIEGRVLLRVHVDTDGQCDAIHVLASSGSPLLDAAASTGVRRWRFQPATRAGTPVASWVDVPIAFRLTAAR